MRKLLLVLIILLIACAVYHYSASERMVVAIAPDGRVLACLGTDMDVYMGKQLTYRLEDACRDMDIPVGSELWVGEKPGYTVYVGVVQSSDKGAVYLTP